MVQQALGQFQPPLHASGKGFRFFIGPVRQSHAAQHLGNAGGERTAAQPIKMSLVPKVFGRSKLDVDALRLEDDPDLSAQVVGSLAAS